MKKGHFANRTIEPLEKLSNIKQKSVIGQEIGNAYGYIGIAFHSIGYFRKAIEYHEKHLKVAMEIGDRAGEEKGYRNLAYAY